MLEITFNQFDHNFCESTIYSDGPHPEYFNTISSLFITFIGLNAIRKPNLSILFNIMYSCLAVNGVLSFLYHYYNSIGYGLLDRMSMILLGWTTSYICYMTIKQTKVYQFTLCINIMVYLSITLYYSFLLTIAGLHKEFEFNVLFTIFLYSISIYVYVVQNVVDKRVSLIGWKGVRYIFTSAVFWIITEGLCGYLPFIKYLFGHVWWHIFVSYGGYLVSIVPQYIVLYHKKHEHENIEIRHDIFGLPYLVYTDIV